MNHNELQNILEILRIVCIYQPTSNAETFFCFNKLKTTWGKMKGNAASTEDKFVHPLYFPS